MQIVNAAATFAVMVVVLTIVEFREVRAPLGQVPMRLTASAVNMSAIDAGVNSTVDINIERWSTDGESRRLATTFVERGPGKLLDTLQDMKRVGYIRLPNSLGYDLHFARLLPLDHGGRRLILATNRRIAFSETRQPREVDYPFTLIEIRLNADRSGEGKIALATTVSMNSHYETVELENYSSEPVRLQHVTVE
jgi:hypothetical protein